MTQTRTRRDIARDVAAQTGMSFAQARSATDAVLEAIANAIVEAERLELRNFGIFEVANQGQRKLKHPVTGKPVKVPPQKIIRFRAGKSLKNRLNK